MENQNSSLNNSQFVWKYMASDGLIKTLENLSIRANQAQNLNDIYDSNPPFTFSDEPEDNCIIQNYRDNSRQGVIGSLCRRCFVTCFTESGADNILMWGHYTGNYFGGVIEFKRISPFFSNLEKVEYVDNAVSISPDLYYYMSMQNTDKVDIKKAFADLPKMYTVKYKDWEYEKELRYYTYLQDDQEIIPEFGKDFVLTKTVENNNTYCYIPFQAADINAIYLGKKFILKDVDYLAQLELTLALLKNNIHVPIYELKEKVDSYQFGFIDITIKFTLEDILFGIWHICELFQNENNDHKKIYKLLKEEVVKYISTEANKTKNYYGSIINILSTKFEKKGA